MQAELKSHPTQSDEARFKKMIKKIDNLPEAKRMNVLLALLSSYFEHKKNLDYIK